MVLSSCGMKPMVLTEFPETPEILMEVPPKMSIYQLKDNPKLSDIAEEHVKEVQLYYMVRQQLLSLQEWIILMKKDNK
jgi:hypothetical protein